MTADPVPPKFLSVEFHTRFFPWLLQSRLQRKRKGSEGTTFTSTLEMMIVLAVCVILALVGIPSAVTQGSIIGWILSIIGVGGMIALVIVSVGAQWGDPPSYDNFLIGVFFFFVVMGIFVGIPVGMDNHSLWLGVSASVPGLVAGYVVGILAGLRLQHLGWIAVVVNMLAGFAAIIMGGAAIVILLLLMPGG